ncbi:hypothetical protein PSACC_01976 [Paramicrosporidium saccamoebae]|uniref:Uncharacterized protein n=1 Tax=Paramicrosporidium saccamoebae TaxID=1246581 RepID=A0A2H9TKN4_9FUNG|nr:hypothetical protein PSACC_01976 [Paramicrosporidium saccamoebae]
MKLTSNAYVTVATRVDAIRRLEERVNELVECEPENVINLLQESFRLDQLTPFRAVLALCMTEIPYKNSRWGPFYSKVWKKRGTAYLEALLEEGRCIEGELMEMFIRLISGPPHFNPFVSYSRMVLLRDHCRKDKFAIKKLLVTLQTRWGDRLNRSVYAALGSWLNHASATSPDWPYATVLEEAPLGRVRMASVVGTTSNKLYRYVKPVTSDGRFPSKTCYVIQNLQDMTISERESRSFGTYGFDKNLSVSTFGDMGVWIFGLDQDASGIQMNVTPICDSIWGQDDCTTLSVPLPKYGTSNLVILMGMRSLLKDSSKQILQGSLQYSDVSSFDETIRQWFGTLKVDVDARPTITASYIFHH